MRGEAVAGGRRGTILASTGLLLWLGAGYAAVEDGGAECPRPWSFPDRWHDADGSDTYNPDPVQNPEEFYDSYVTGYKEPADTGLQLALRLTLASQTDFGHSSYYAVAYPPVNKGDPVHGASQYVAWILGCVDSSFAVEAADTLILEPGYFVGPTLSGVNALIALDPGAHWDEASNGVAGSAYPTSPRIVEAPLLHPAAGVVCPEGSNAVVVAKIVSLFIESVGADALLTVRFMREVSSEETTSRADSWGGVKSHWR
jgi:hypothetical protein